MGRESRRNKSAEHSASLGHKLLVKPKVEIHKKIRTQDLAAVLKLARWRKANRKKK